MNKKNSKKFNLLEVVLAMVLMAIALIPLFGIMSRDVQDQDVAASHSYAMELATSYLDYFLETVPFEAIYSKGGGVPCVVKGQSDARYQSKKRDGSGNNTREEVKGLMEKLVKAKYFDESGVEKTFEPVIKDGGIEARWFKSDFRGITYQISLYSTDFKDDDGKNFNGSSPTAYNGWKELYFDAYETPNFDYQSKWKKNNNDTIFQAKESTISPYAYMGGGPEGGKGWGEAQRDHKGGVLKFKEDYPKDQGDVSEIIPDWGYFCTLKKLYIEVRWNLSPAFAKKPTAEKAPGSRPKRLFYTTFKGDLFR